MENRTLQVTAWYDGLGKGKLGIELADADGNTAWIVIKQVRPFAMESQPSNTTSPDGNPLASFASIR